MQLASSITLRQARWVPILVTGTREGTDTRPHRYLPESGVSARAHANEPPMLPGLSYRGTPPKLKSGDY